MSRPVIPASVPGVRLQVEVVAERAPRPAGLACRWSAREAGVWTDFGAVTVAPVREWALWDDVHLLANGVDGTVLGIQGYCPREAVPGASMPQPTCEARDADVIVVATAGTCDYEVGRTEHTFVASDPTLTPTTVVRPGADGLTLGIAGDVLCRVEVQRADGGTLLARAIRRVAPLRRL